MSRHTLYAYVEGSDLHDVAETLNLRLSAFLASREWHCAKVWLVNQSRPDDPSLQPGDLPDWELGINLELPDPGRERPGWFSDIEAIARFFGVLHKDTGRCFVIGIGDNDTRISEDLFFVESASPDLSQLRQIIGVGQME
jgi:hypothetical protein